MNRETVRYRIVTATGIPGSDRYYTEGEARSRARLRDEEDPDGAPRSVVKVTTIEGPVPAPWPNEPITVWARVMPGGDVYLNVGEIRPKGETRLYRTLVPPELWEEITEGEGS